MPSSYLSPFYGNKTHVIVPLFLLLFLHFFTTELLTVPTLRLIERAICMKFYLGEHRPSEIPELECKNEAVQNRLVYIFGWLSSLACLPGLVTAYFWGVTADKYGRRLVLALGCVGEILAMAGLLAVGIWNDVFPIELVLATPFLTFIGGGSRVVISMIQSVASDITEPSQRTKLFYFMALLMDIANAAATALESWTLSSSLWLPFQLAAALSALILVLVWILPESRQQEFKPTPSIDRGELAALLEEVPATENSHSNRRHDHGISKAPRLHKLQVLLSNHEVSIILVCSFLKRTAFFSETFIVQYASEKWRLVHSQAVWFNVMQPAGAIFALGLVLPLSTNYLQTRLRSPRAVDLLTIRVNLGLLVAAYSTLWWSSTIPVFAAAMFFCGSGEGAEPALQGLASSLVEPSQYATLFTTMTLVESVGRLIAGPLMAYLLRIGRNIDGEPTGLIFLLSAALFLTVLAASALVTGDEIAEAEPEGSETE